MGDYFDCASDLIYQGANINTQGQEILQPEDTDTPSSGTYLRWLIVIVILGLLFGGGYWYYSRYIMKPTVAPTVSPEVTEAVWKTKSEKTVNDFLGYWLKSENDEEQAKKARDLLTIAAQAKLEILKNQNGNNFSSLKDKLTAFLELPGFPKDYKFIITKKIDEKTVEVTAKFNYPQGSEVRVFTCLLEGNAWLIDAVKYESITATPLISPSPSPSSSSSINSSPSPTMSPTTSPGGPL